MYMYKLHINQQLADAKSKDIQIFKDIQNLRICISLETCINRFL